MDKALLKYNRENPTDDWSPQGTAKTRKLPDGRTVQLNSQAMQYLDKRTGVLARATLTGLTLAADEASQKRIQSAYSDARGRAWDEIKFRPIEKLGTIRED